MNARVPLDRAIASATCIPHPRQEPVMSAPAPSPAGQAVIDRFGIYEAEEARERVASWLRRLSCEDPPNVAGQDFIDLSLTWADEVIALSAPLAGQHTTDEEER